MSHLQATPKLNSLSMFNILGRCGSAPWLIKVEQSEDISFASLINLTP